MESEKPIAEAINRLFEMSTRNDDSWSILLGCKEDDIQRWRRGVSYPNDRQMTMIIREMEYTKGSKWNQQLPVAIDNFWNVLEHIEQTCQLTELSCEHCESISERLIRFTNDGWLQNLRSSMSFIPARRRADFFEDIHKLVGKHTK